MQFTNEVILAAHTSLLGSIGNDVLAISLSEGDNGLSLTLNVFYFSDLAEEQVEELRSSTTELYTKVEDTWNDVTLSLQKVEHTNLIPRIGLILFRRLGTRYS